MTGAEELVKTHFDDFLEQFICHRFNYSNVNCNIVIRKIRSYLESDTPYKVIYKQHRSRRNLAWITKGDLYTININTRNLGRSDQSIAGSIAHEIVHLVNNRTKEYRFSHPSLRFWRKKKVLNSAPYVIGREFKKYLESLC